MHVLYILPLPVLVKSEKFNVHGNYTKFKINSVAFQISMKNTDKFQKPAQQADKIKITSHWHRSDAITPKQQL